MTLGIDAMMRMSAYVSLSGHPGVVLSNIIRDISAC